MEQKLKGILEILEDEKKKKHIGKKDEKTEKEEKLEKLEKVFTEMERFSFNKKNSSSFEYVKVKYLAEDCEKNLHLSFSEDFEEDSYLKCYKNNFKHGKETIKLYVYIREYSNNSEYGEEDADPIMDLDYVQKLIDEGADVNFVNNYGDNDTCLMQAVQSENINLIKKLLENGANPNIEQKNLSLNFYCSIMQDVFSLAIDNYDEEKDYAQLFAAMVEVCDADIYMKNSHKHYAIVDFVNNELEDEQKNIAILLLEPYGFTEEDFGQNGLSNRKKTSAAKNNIKSNVDKEFDQDFDKEFIIPENL